MDLTVILTGMGTALAIIGANVSLISWLRSDMKSFENEIRANMKSFEHEIRTDMNSFGNEVRGWKDEIKNEMRDFHGRLCAIEQARKK